MFSASLEYSLLNFFKQVAQKEPFLLCQLNEHDCFNIKQNYWKFTLPDLYWFLQRQNQQFKKITYINFRKLIYSSPINKTLKEFNVKVVISDNKGNVDKSLYSMIWTLNFS